MARETMYPKIPVVVTFKTSNRSNAKTKKKVFNNRNIDEILDPDTKLPGIPSNAIIEHIGIGKSFV